MSIMENVERISPKISSILPIKPCFYAFVSTGHMPLPFVRVRAYILYI